MIFLKKKKLEKIFKKEAITYVINLAAQAGVRYSLKNPDSYIKSNIVGFANILNNCKKFKIKHLFYASSSSVYGQNSHTKFSEDQKTDSPIQLYAATKKSNELMAYSYSSLYKIPTTGLRFFTVYGPWGRPDMAYFSFTKKIIEGKKIKIFNFGKQSRDFTYIDDTINILLLIIKKMTLKKIDKSKTHHEIFNIGKGKADKLLKYIKAIENCLGKKAKKKYVKHQSGDMVKTLSSNNKLKKFLRKKYFKFTSIEVGISKFISWYLKFYN